MTTSSPRNVSFIVFTCAMLIIISSSIRHVYADLGANGPAPFVGRMRHYPLGVISEEVDRTSQELREYRFNLDSCCEGCTMRIYMLFHTDKRVKGRVQVEEINETKGELIVTSGLTQRRILKTLTDAGISARPSNVVNKNYPVRLF